jgi:glyoxylase-like metal-dependent hydrolase (beta-lactamase superfamily II)
MIFAVTILGCGLSGGVTRWGDCDPSNPKNRRRCSILVVRTAPDGEMTRVLVDSGPDLREQLLAADVTRVDGVLDTHEHADHIHGIDDLRPLFPANCKRVDIYTDDRPYSATPAARAGSASTRSITLPRRARSWTRKLARCCTGRTAGERITAALGHLRPPRRADDDGRFTFITRSNCASNF